MTQEEIEWKLFEFAEGQLTGEEYHYWKNQIITNPKIATQYELICATYLTTTFTDSLIPDTSKHPINPLGTWGNNLVFNDKNNLKHQSFTVTNSNSNIHLKTHSSASTPLGRVLYLWNNALSFRGVSVAAAVLVIGFLFWQSVFNSANQSNIQQGYTNNNTPTKTELSTSSKTIVETQRNPRSKKSTYIQTTINSSEPLQTVLNNHPNNHLYSTPNSTIHPLITATENYLSSESTSTSDKLSVVGNDETTSSTSQGITVFAKANPLFPEAPLVDETIITVINNQPKSAKAKRQFVSYNIKEMMRKGQLPGIKIQPLNANKTGLLPPFRFEVDINQVPVYQTSNY